MFPRQMTQLDDIYICHRPPPVAGFLTVSRAMLRGASELSGPNAKHKMAVTLLCGHGVETALKAALHKCGLTVEQLCDLRHNLQSLLAYSCR